MAKRKPKEVDRRPLGLYVGNGNAGPHVVQFYEVRYSDGTTKTERGHAIFVFPGLSDLNPWMIPKSEKQLRKKLWRPDLDIPLRMVHQAWESLSMACWRADDHKDKPHGRSAKSNRRKGTRR